MKRFVISVAVCMVVAACGGKYVEPENDGGPPAPDAWQDALHGDAAPDTGLDVGPPPDLKRCVPGAACNVVGAQGACRKGEMVCEASGVGTCMQTVQPTVEKCDGIDSNCNGILDADDLEAHQSCGAGKFCDGSVCQPGCSGDGDCTNGNTCDKASSKCVCGTRDGCTGESKCVDGQCLCGGTIKCASGETCTGGKCVCGSQSSSTGPVCKQPNPRCVTGHCVCDSNSTCNELENCASGVCNCGGTAGPAEGPFCRLGTCDPVAGECEGIPPDAGPDVGPDVGVDQGPELDAPQLDPDSTVDAVPDTTADATADSTVDGATAAWTTCQQIYDCARQTCTSLSEMTCVLGCNASGCSSAQAAVLDLRLCADDQCATECATNGTPCDNCVQTSCATEYAACVSNTCP